MIWKNAFALVSVPDFRCKGPVSSSSQLVVCKQKHLLALPLRGQMQCSAILGTIYLPNWSSPLLCLFGHACLAVLVVPRLP